MASLIQEDRLEDSQIVMRRVRDYETITDSSDGLPRPSSNAFIQDGPDGDVSVYLKSETTAAHITGDYPGTYVAEVEVGIIRAHGLDVERDPIPSDPGHCNITGRKSRGRARSIARNSRWADGHGPTQVAQVK